VSRRRTRSRYQKLHPRADVIRSQLVCHLMFRLVVMRII
jgi:hypothetical protein